MINLYRWILTDWVVWPARAFLDGDRSDFLARLEGALTWHACMWRVRDDAGMTAV